MILMNVATLRWVDRWVGIPLAFLLTRLRSLTRGARRDRRRPIGRLLFVKLAEQGSTVLACGAIRRAVRMVGRENVYFLVFEENRFIVDVLGLIPTGNVVAIRNGSLLTTLLSAVAAVWRLRRLRPDAAVDLEFFARASAVFAFLSGAAWRVGFHSYGGDGPYRGDLMTHRLVYNPHLHTSQVFEIMVEALNHPVDLFPAFGMTAPPVGREPVPQFVPEASELRAMQALIQNVTGQPEVPPMILLNANCSDLLPLRRWDTENYVRLARRLLDRYPGLYIGFTGAPAEKAPVDRVVHAVGSERCVSFAGRTTLRELLVLYSLSHVLVTNDSGPAHFAVLTPVDVVTLFGPETPQLFGAPSERSHILWAGIVCSPCVNAYNNRLLTCRNNVCMQRISVDEVFEKTCEIFEKRMARGGEDAEDAA